MHACGKIYFLSIGIKGQYLYKYLFCITFGSLEDAPEYAF